MSSIDPSWPKCLIGYFYALNSKSQIYLSGSKFYENEMRRGAIIKEQVEEKLTKLRSLTPADIEVGEKEVNNLSPLI